jgi:hypothetical protein|nr:MAG TPA: hypothetical protein [Caudoviricetes sp.]
MKLLKELKDLISLMGCMIVSVALLAITTKLIAIVWNFIMAW